MPPLITDLRRRLRAAADPARAPAMQAYMKSAMPFHGVPTPRRRALTRALWRERGPDSAPMWRAQVESLWEAASHREERYAALDWCRYGRSRARGAWHEPALLPLLEHLIVAGAWWDIVDEVAGQHLGELLRRNRAPISAAMRAWARGEDLWKRRAAILCQLDAKAGTDTDLLADCIAPSLAPSPFAREFFIAKGLGWALRQYARHDPAWVRRYLREHAAALPALSRREAAKHLSS